MVYSFRNLIISFIIVISVVLLILFRTFSTLSSLETEQIKIQQSRDVLQKLGVAVSDMQELESIRANYFNSGNDKLRDFYSSSVQKILDDSLNLAGLAATHPTSGRSYQQLNALIHTMKEYAAENILPQKEQDAGNKAAPVNQETGIITVERFKKIANELEEIHRGVLKTSYSNSISLTRETFSFVRIISVLLAVFLIVSFYFVYHDVKTRKSTEEQLKKFNDELSRQVNIKTSEIRKAEEKYGPLFESMTDAYAKADMNGRIVEVNPAFRNMLGYSEEEICTMSYTDFTPAKWVSKDEDIVRTQVLTRGFSEVYEKEYIHKSGRVFPVELRIFLIKNDAGENIARWAIVRDISARKVAEKKLEVSEKNLRQVLASTSDNFYVIDRNCRVILINEAAERNLEKAWGKPVTLGTNILDLVPPEEQEPIKSSIDKVFSGEKVEYELEIANPELPGWVLVTYTPVIDESGGIVAAHIVAKDITQRKQTEKELIEAEAKFRNLVEQSIIGVYIIQNGKFAYVNPGLGEIFGYGQEEFLNDCSIEDVIHPDDRAIVKENIRVRVDGEQDTIHYEAKGLRKDGEVITVEIFCSGTLFEGSSAIIGTMLDISARKKSEEAIKKSEERYRALVENAPEALVVLDMERGKFISVSESAENLFRMTREQLLKLGPVDLSPDYQPNGRLSSEMAMEKLSEAVAGNKTNFEWTHCDREGNLIPCEVWLVRFPADNQVLIRGSIIDISERKEAEQKLQKSESRYRSVIEQASDAIMITDQKGNFVEVNSALCKQFGYTKEELMRLNVAQLIDPAHLKSEPIDFETLLQGKPIFRERKMIHKNGTIYEVEANVKMLPDGRLLAIARDITERKQIEKEKEHTRHLLNERIKELTTLYRSSQIFQTENKSIHEVLQEIVTVLPTGWQYTDITAARIVLEKIEFKTPNFATGPHKQIAEFITPGGKIGIVEIVYLEEKPKEAEDAFLAEERDLINMIAEMVRVYLARNHEAEMKKMMEKEIMNQKVQEQKRITRAILKGEETERNKIGQELHDNVNQILASIKLFLSMAKGKDAETGDELLIRSATLVDNAINEIRLLSQRHVTPVKKVNLEELIRSLVDRLNDSTAIKTAFEYDLNGQVIQDDLKLNVYRIVQEQINNILKHADAVSVFISINTDKEFLYISINDDGKGFDLQKKRTGVGITNMMNRVESFNGELEIESSSGRGTHLRIKIPC